MDSGKEANPTMERLRRLALATGVNLDDEGMDALLPQIERLFAGIERLNALVLTETEPATKLTLREG